MDSVNRGNLGSLESFIFQAVKRCKNSADVINKIAQGKDAHFSSLAPITYAARVLGKKKEYHDKAQQHYNQSVLLVLKGRHASDNSYKLEREIVLLRKPKIGGCKTYLLPVALREAAIFTNQLIAPVEEKGGGFKITNWGAPDLINEVIEKSSLGLDTDFHFQGSSKKMFVYDMGIINIGLRVMGLLRSEPCLQLVIVSLHSEQPVEISIR